MNAAMRALFPLGLLLLCLGAAASVLAAQDKEGATGVTAALTTSKRWSWQCEPIRCTLQITNHGAKARIRIPAGGANQPLYPFELEREHDGAWVPIQPPKKRGRPHPARMLISMGTGELAPDESLTLEAEIWDLDAVSQPGRIRIRFAVDARPADPKESRWVAANKIWLELEILPHEANATHFLGDDAANLRARYNKMSNSLNWTVTTSKNFGPYNAGPAGPFGPAPAKFIRHTDTAKQLLAIDELSPQLRARARLVMAYSTVEQALRANDPEELLLAAKQELDAPEVTASPPSGGLSPLPSGGLQALRTLLTAHIAVRMDGTNPQEAYGQLQQQYPWFAELWSHEIRELLRR